VHAFVSIDRTGIERRERGIRVEWVFSARLCSAVAAFRGPAGTVGIGEFAKIMKGQTEFRVQCSVKDHAEFRALAKRKGAKSLSAFVFWTLRGLMLAELMAKVAKSENSK
jgi:hypothetical protein